MSAVSLRRDWYVFSVKLVQAIKRIIKMNCARSAMALAFMVEQQFIK
jgi:hypothetical protein